MMPLKFLGAVRPVIFHVPFDIPAINPDVPEFTAQIFPISGQTVHIGHQGSLIDCDRRLVRVGGKVRVELDYIAPDISEIPAHVFEVGPNLPEVRPDISAVMSERGVVTPLLAMLTRDLFRSIQSAQLTASVASFRTHVGRECARSQITAIILVPTGSLISKQQIDARRNGRIVGVLDRHVGGRGVGGSGGPTGGTSVHLRGDRRDGSVVGILERLIGGRGVSAGGCTVHLRGDRRDGGVVGILERLIGGRGISAGGWTVYLRGDRRDSRVVRVPIHLVRVGDIARRGGPISRAPVLSPREGAWSMR